MAKVAFTSRVNFSQGEAKTQEQGVVHKAMAVKCTKEMEVPIP
jgi:hypothetical protein